MNGNRGKLPVSSAESVHRSTRACRQIAKAYSPSKIPDCTMLSNRFSSALRKGQNTYNGRRAARGSIMETVLLATNGERNRLVGGKIVPEQRVSPTSPKVADGGNLHDFFSIKPEQLDNEMKKLEESSFSDPGLNRHATDLPRQQCSSEKVSKWLEESEITTIIIPELTDSHNLDDNEERVGNGPLQRLATGTDSAVYDRQDVKQLVEMLPRNIHATQARVKVLNYEHTRFRGWSETKVLTRYFKLTVCLSVASLGLFMITMCLSVEFLGLFMQMRPTSWDQYEPPPT